MGESPLVVRCIRIFVVSIQIFGELSQMLVENKQPINGCKKYVQESYESPMNPLSPLVTNNKQLRFILRYIKIIEQQSGINPQFIINPIHSIPIPMPGGSTWVVMR